MKAWVILLPLMLVSARLAPLSPALLTQPAVNCCQSHCQAIKHHLRVLCASEQLCSGLEAQHLFVFAGDHQRVNVVQTAPSKVTRCLLGAHVQG